MARASGYTQPRGWAKLRDRILNEADHRCYSPHPLLCIGDATTVDHLVPVSQGGSVDDEANLAPICTPCHDHKSELERRAGYARRRPKVTRQRTPEQHPGAIRT